MKDLVEKYRDRILHAENLVIDIRGDEGGSSGTTRSLMPFLVTPSKRATPYEGSDHEVVVSSPDNITYFEQMQSQGWVPAKLAERMRASPGKVIPLDDPGSESSTPPALSTDPPTPLPRNVAILIDGAVESAGEAFVLNVMKNKKVTLFGENTGGVIDYQSVNIVGLPNCPSGGLYLGYPTTAASDRLPVGGINPKGIAPDVRIGHWVKDPIRFIINYYECRGRQSVASPRVRTK